MVSKHRTIVALNAVFFKPFPIHSFSKRKHQFWHWGHAFPSYSLNGNSMLLYYWLCQSSWGDAAGMSEKAWSWCPEVWLLSVMLIVWIVCLPHILMPFLHCCWTFEKAGWIPGGTWAVLTSLFVCPCLSIKYFNEQVIGLSLGFKSDATPVKNSIISIYPFLVRILCLNM